VDSLVKKLGWSSNSYVSINSATNVSKTMSLSIMQGSKTSSEKNACHERGNELAVGVLVDLWQLDQQHNIFLCFGMQILLKLGMSFVLESHHLVHLQNVSINPCNYVGVRICGKELQFFGISFQSLDYLEIEIFLFTIW
jgi:hypothetical protein